MLDWYEDENIGIYFSDTPDVTIRYVDPYEDKIRAKEICTKPFLLKNNIKVVLIDWRNSIKKDEPKNYEFTIPAYYCWDGATIPRMFWRLIGPKTDPRFLIPSLIHDVLCENHNYVDNDRYFADKVFERLLYVSGVSAFSRWMMFHSVDNFQKFCNWK